MGHITSPGARSPDKLPFNDPILLGQLHVSLAATVELTRPYLSTVYHHQSLAARAEKDTKSSISTGMVGSCPAKTSTAFWNAFKGAAPAVCPVCMLQVYS